MQNYLPEELKKFKSISNMYDVYFVDLMGRYSQWYKFI